MLRAACCDVHLGAGSERRRQRACAHLSGVRSPASKHLNVPSTPGAACRDRVETMGSGALVDCSRPSSSDSGSRGAALVLAKMRRSCVGLQGLGSGAVGEALRGAAAARGACTALQVGLVRLAGAQTSALSQPFSSCVPSAGAAGCCCHGGWQTEPDVAGVALNAQFGTHAPGVAKGGSDASGGDGLIAMGDSSRLAICTC